MTITKIHIVHDYDEQSNPYVAEVEAALDAVKALGLTERGWDKSGRPGIIRHETGPEIFALLVGAVELTAALIHLISMTRKRHPETVVNISVSDPNQIRDVL